MMKVTNSGHGITRRELITLGAASAVSICAPREVAALVSPPSRADSVILVWLDGGPSAQETFDPRPDAPVDLRGPLGAIRTTVPGIPIGALMPRTARLMHLCTLARTVSHSETLHHRACRAHLTVSDAKQAHRSPIFIGAVAEQRPVVFGSRGFGSGYGLAGNSDLTEILPGSTSWACAADSEPARIRETYGRSQFGASCLLARWLVERGIRFVTVCQTGWDAHCDAIEISRDWLVPTLDEGLSALLSDLRQRGLLERTLVVVTGEFGRTPRLNALGGRDHSPAAGFALLAGAGIPKGHAIGEVDTATGEPLDLAVSPAAISSTILAKMGLSGHRIASELG
jgi:hypothetical protein